MPVNESVEAVSLGFSTADASSPAIHLGGQTLEVRFVDWQDRPVALTCRDVFGVRWQEAEHYLGQSERFDGTYRVVGSAWIAEHEGQGLIPKGLEVIHLKLNFNASGILEVLCASAVVGE